MTLSNGEHHYRIFELQNIGNGQYTILPSVEAARICQALSCSKCKRVLFGNRCQCKDMQSTGKTCELVENEPGPGENENGLGLISAFEESISTQQDFF